MATEYSWSTDQERYQGQHSSKEEAVLEAIIEGDLQVGDSVTVGEVLRCTKKQFLDSAVSIDDILERIGEAAYDEVGDLSEEWPNQISVGKANELQDAIVELIAPHIEEPTFWSIGDTEDIEIDEELYSKAYDGKPPED